MNPKEPRAWFGQARLLLTVIEDPDKGIAALQKALELGFNDREAIKVLLASPGLQARDQVEAALKTRSLLPDSGAAGLPEKGTSVVPEKGSPAIQDKSGTSSPASTP